MRVDNFLHRAFAHRARDHAGLAEAAAARAAAHNFDRDPVLHHVDRWDQEAGDRWGELANHAFDHRVGRLLSLSG